APGVEMLCLAVEDNFNACCLAPLDQDAGRRRLHEEMDVAAAQGGAQEPRRSAAAQALADGKIHMAEGLPARAVQIVGDAVSGGCSCFEEEVADGCSGATNRHVQCAGAPV